MSENTLQQKIDNLGSDTIMGTMNGFDRTKLKEYADKVAEKVEANREEAGELNNTVVTGGEALESVIAGDQLGALQRAGYFKKTRPIVRDNKKIRRNDPCPCGSGKKYKNCCLNSGRFETTHFE